MENTKELLSNRFRGSIFFLSLIVAALIAGCSDDGNDLADSRTTKASIPNPETNARNSSSQTNDYTISITVVDFTWTYIITKNPGAKDLSHFILNFQNCGSSSATINNIVWATVNGQPAVLENSEGKTGCNVQDVTTNFVKFDNLPSASSYTIVFELDTRYGNFVGTTAWLKAGNSCITYPVLAPCCA